MSHPAIPIFQGLRCSKLVQRVLFKEFQDDWGGVEARNMVPCLLIIRIWFSARPIVSDDGIIYVLHQPRLGSRSKLVRHSV